MLLHSLYEASRGNFKVLFRRQKDAMESEETTYLMFLFHMRLSYGYFNKNAGFAEQCER